MSTDELGEVLRGERRLTPSADFASRVMRAIEAEATAREGLAFPWRRLVVGLVACAATAVAGAIAIEVRGEGGPPSIDLEATIGDLQRSGMFPALVWMSVALAGCYFVTWVSMRLAGSRR